jgi:hypothetical protein
MGERKGMNAGMEILLTFEDVSEITRIKVGELWGMREL